MTELDKTKMEELKDVIVAFHNGGYSDDSIAIAVDKVYKYAYGRYDTEKVYEDLLDETLIIYTLFNGRDVVWFGGKRDIAIHVDDLTELSEEEEDEIADQL